VNSHRDPVTHAILVLGAILFAAPLWLVFVGSTQDSAAIARGELSFLPGSEGFSAYARVLNGPVPRMLLISLGMAMAIAIGKIIISVLSAFAVAFFRFPGRQIAFWLIFITLMLPVEVRIIPTYSVMADLGLINTFTGLWLPLIASATATLLFRQVFVAIPDELVRQRVWMGRVHCAFCGTSYFRFQHQTSRPCSLFFSFTAGINIFGPYLSQPTPGSIQS